MSSGVIYPPPTYLPPLSVFNPLFFPQSFGTTTTGGGGGGGFTNIFPNGLTSGNVITMDGGTGGGGGTGLERRITGLSQIDWVDINSTNPTTITGYMTLNGNTLEIGSNTASSGINVNLLGSVVSANGTPIATGGNVSNDQNNTFQPTFTQTFQGQIVVDNTQSNIGQYSNNNTGIGDNVLTSITTGTNNIAFGVNALSNQTTGSQNVAVGVLSLNSLTSGNINTAVGYASLQNSILDNGNTAIGLNAGQNLSGSGTDSNYNTFVGEGAGAKQTIGSYNVAVGNNTGASPTLTNLSNTIAIGANVNPSANGDMIFGFGTYTGSIPYYAKITPNTTDGGVQIQGTYNNNGNFTINAVGQSAIIKGTFVDLTATSAVNVSNLVATPNNPVINTTNLGNGSGTFYVSSQLPYFAYNNGGTITSQQLATTTNNVLFTITTSAGTGTGTPPTQPTIWTFTLPNGVYPQQFNYYAYQNILAGAGTTLSLPNYTTGTAIVNQNTNGNTTFFQGQAVYTTWNVSPSPPTIVSGYGYFFNVSSLIGSTGFSIRTISQGNNSAGTTTYQIYSTGIYNTNTFTIVGVAIP
jgi:hypothetical protein